MAQCTKINSTSRLERVSAFTSRASITVEATFAVSFFFMAIMCLVCIFEVLALQINIKCALHSAGKEIAEEAYLNKMFFPSRLEERIVELVGEEKLDQSMIIGGSRGIDCSATKTYVGSTIIDLSACYQVKIPVPLFQIPVVAREEIVRIKGWSGDEERSLEGTGQQMVYVTEHGLVYHKELSCTYLSMAIKAVLYEEIEGLRNENGGIYYPCERCGEKELNVKQVYITEQGVRYHGSLTCGGIKRKIYTVPLSETGGLGGCSKCAK